MVRPGTAFMCRTMAHCGASDNIGVCGSVNVDAFFEKIQYFSGGGPKTCRVRGSGGKNREGGASGWRFGGKRQSAFLFLNQIKRGIPSRRGSVRRGVLIILFILIILVSRRPFVACLSLDCRLLVIPVAHWRRKGLIYRGLWPAPWWSFFRRFRDGARRIGPAEVSPRPACSCRGRSSFR